MQSFYLFQSTGPPGTVGVFDFPVLVWYWHSFISSWFTILNVSNPSDNLWGNYLKSWKARLNWKNKTTEKKFPYGLKSRSATCLPSASPEGTSVSSLIWGKEGFPQAPSTGCSLLGSAWHFGKPLVKLIDTVLLTTPEASFRAYKPIFLKTVTFPGCHDNARLISSKKTKNKKGEKNE